MEKRKSKTRLQKNTSVPKMSPKKTLKPYCFQLPKMLIWPSGITKKCEHFFATPGFSKIHLVQQKFKTQKHSPRTPLRILDAYVKKKFCSVKILRGVRGDRCQNFKTKFCFQWLIIKNHQIWHVHTLLCLPCPYFVFVHRIIVFSPKKLIRRKNNDSTLPNFLQF